MSYFRRGYSWEQTHYIGAPSGGWNPDTVPWELPANQAQTLDNFIPRPDRIVMRGPLSLAVNYGAVVLSIGGYVNGFAPGSNYWWYMTPRNVTGASFVDPWNVPLLLPSSGAALSSWAGATKAVVNGATVANVLGTADQAPGPRWINFDGLLYGISFDSAGAVVHDVNSTYAMKPLSLLTLPYSQAGATLPTVLANAPHGAFDIKGHQSRLWLLGGVDTPGAGTTHSPTTLFFTIPGTSGVGTASADWKDPVSALTNQIKMDNNNQDFGVALAVTRGSLVVFRYQSVWLLRGSTTASYTLTPISKETGCIDARSVVETDHGIYFLSRQGLMLTDGTKVQNVSGGVRNHLTDAITNLTSFMFGGNIAGTAVSCTMLGTGHLLVSLGYYDQTGNFNPIFSGLFDPSTAAWSRITSSLWTQENVGANAPGYAPLLMRSFDKQRVLAIGDKYLVTVEDQTALSGITRVNVRGSNALYDWDGTTAYPIPAVWQSRLAPTVSTSSRKFGQLKRYFCDYAFTGITLQTATAWKVTPYSASGVAYGNGLSVPQSASGVTYYINKNGQTIYPVQTVQRVNGDQPSEIDDISFKVTYPDTNQTSRSNNVVAEVYGVGLEFQPGRDLR